MHKIHQLFLIKFLSLFIGSFILFSVIGYFSIKSIIIEENTTYLTQTIKIITPLVQNEKELDKLIKKLAKDTLLRITLIDKDGLVVGESSTDKSTMSNHAKREEILIASKGTIGKSLRFSDTLKVDFLYVAKRVSYQNEILYIRLAKPLTVVMDALYTLWVKLIIAFVIVLIIAYFIAQQMSHRVLYDIKQLKAYLEEIGSKNYEAIVHIKYIHEFLELSLILKNIIKRLHKKDKKK